MRSRIVILVVAIMLGVLAAALTGRYLSSLERGVAAEDEPIEVLVAQGSLTRGAAAEELIEAGLIARQSIPRRYVAEGAVSSASSIEGQVLAEDVSTGEQITQTRFRFPSQAGLAYSIPADHVAVAISNNAVKGVAGLVKPGDHVMAVVTLDPGPGGEPVSQVFIRKARVLAVGATLGSDSDVRTVGGGGGLGGGDEQAAQAEAAATITLALTPEDVERLVFAEEKGDVWLALLGSTETDIPVTTGQSLQSILGQ